MAPLSSAGRAAGQIVDPAQARALRLRNYQKLLAQGPEALAKRAAIAAENRAARQARAAAREGRAAPIVEQMRQNQAALGEDIPRPNPAAAAPEAVPGAATVDDGRYLVDRDRAQAILEKVTEEGWDSLLPDELIVIEDLQAGRARLSGSVERVPESPGDITDAASEPLDNLEQSATEIGEAPAGGGGAANLKPKQARGPTPAEKLASTVFAAMAESDIESLSPRTVTNLQKQVAKMSATPEGRAELVAAMGNADEAERRLARLQQLSDDFTRDPQAAAAQRIAETADERAASGTPRTPRQSLMEGVGPGLPSIVERFNSLPEPVKADIVRRLDPTARAIIESGGGASSISPNALAEVMRPVNPVSELLDTLDDALRNGANSEADAARELVRNAPEAQRAAAIAAYRRRQAIDASLRTAMTQAEPSPQVLASPGQPSLRRPGAMSPEAAIEEVPTRELPGQFEEALAAADEQTAARERRAAGGGLDEDTRKQMAGLEPEDNLRSAPFYLRGRDGRPTPFESRSRGARGIESNDLRAMQKYLAASEKVRLANTPEEEAAALAELATAESELARKFPRGRKEMSDSRLNSAGQQETYDDLVLAMAGFRPKAGQNIGRSSASMSAADRAAQQDEAVRVFGESDAIELMPEPGEIDDVSDLGGSGKKGRLGGNPQFSRRAGATDQMFSQSFGGRNPLEMEEFGGDPLKVADEILSKNTIFKPGTANYEMARERIAQSVRERFATQTRGLTDERPSTVPSQPIGTTQDPAAIPAEGGRVNAPGQPVSGMTADEYEQAQRAILKKVFGKDYLQTAASEVLVDAQGKPIEIDVSGVPVALQPAKPRTQRDFSQPATPSTPEEAALEASAVELGDSSPIPEKPAATPVADSKPVAGKKLTAKEIEAEADRVFKDTLAQEQEAGAPLKQARATANAARLRKVKELQGLNPSDPIPEKPAAAATPQPTPAASKADDVVDSKPVDAPAGTKKNPKADAEKPKDSKDTKPKDGTDAKKADDKANPEKAPPKKSRLPYYLTGGAILAGVTAANMGRGGSGTAVAGGGSVPLVPGGGVNPEAAMAEEDAINRALERLRGSRASAGGGTSQVLQNWTGWR